MDGPVDLDMRITREAPHGGLFLKYGSILGRLGLSDKPAYSSTQRYAMRPRQWPHWVDSQNCDGPNDSYPAGCPLPARSGHWPASSRMAV